MSTTGTSTQRALTFPLTIGHLTATLDPYAKTTAVVKDRSGQTRDWVRKGHGTVAQWHNAIIDTMALSVADSANDKQSQITDAEWEETKARYRAIMAEYGMVPSPYMLAKGERA